MHKLTKIIFQDLKPVVEWFYTLALIAYLLVTFFGSCVLLYFEGSQLFGKTVIDSGVHGSTLHIYTFMGIFFSMYYKEGHFNEWPFASLFVLNASWCSSVLIWYLWPNLVYLYYTVLIGPVLMLVSVLCYKYVAQLSN